MSTIFTGMKHSVPHTGLLGINVLRPIVSILLKDAFYWREVLILYRYISWFLTSLFYLIGSPESTLLYKLIVVLALLFAGRLVLHLYENNKQNYINILVLLTVETLGIAILLIPTGGLDSPFIWYSMNPIFLATSLVPALYCWGILGIFIAAATAGSIYFFDYTQTVQILWKEKAWLLLVFLLLTTAAQMFASLINKLTKAYTELSHAHRISEHYLEHITALYQALESFATGEEPRHLTVLLATFTHRLTGLPAAICWLARQGEFNTPVWAVYDPKGLLPEKIALPELESLWLDIRDDNKRGIISNVAINVDDTREQMLCIPIKSNSECFGVLGCLANSGSNKVDVDKNKAMNFMAELGAIVLERCKTEMLATRLQVAEEQNRIANEIHDGVSQHLFSIVYALHALTDKQTFINKDLKQQLSLIQNTANQAARELRASIYDISPRKQGKSVFISGLKAYLDGMARLNDIKIELKSEGSEESLSPALRKSLYRIIRETTGNALRHGHCTTLTVSLKISSTQTLLTVEDNGCGFNPTMIQDSGNQGLGLGNITHLAESFNGELVINSAPQKGTVVKCFIPRRKDRGTPPKEVYCSENYCN